MHSIVSVSSMLDDLHEDVRALQGGLELFCQVKFNPAFSGLLFSFKGI